jgi:tetratricopeptide (TPR) repeat protein
LVTFLVLLVAGHSWAQAPIPGYPDSIDSFDPREVAMLPPYCTYTHYFRIKVPGGNNVAETERWRARLGSESFEHIHHYCFALMKTNRAVLLARSSTSRSFYLNDSLIEFDYVIERVPPDFLLLPEILMKKGENLLLLGRVQVGVYHLEKATQLKPDYWPPYAKLADHYKDSGDLESARKTLQSGLTANPNASALTRRLEELSKR